MKTLLLPLALFCCGFLYFSGNEDNDLVQIAPDFYVEESLVDSAKTQIIHEVFKRLKAAKGDYRSRKPELHLVTSTGKGIAVAYQLSGVIKLEDKGYDLCKSFGEDAENALAGLLAHEMTHIYEKHSWENLFAWEYSHTTLKSAVSNEQKKDEIQADYLGGVLAYQAGYKVFGVMPKFLDKVYETYKLKDENMTDYPGIEQRKLFAVESEDKFRYFSNLFEMANLLTVKEEYDHALIYYDKVMQDFKSREVYNNIGVVSFQSAAKHFSKTENKFAYPVELDVVSRMSKSGRGDADLDLRERRLLDAIYYFENARHLDPFYPAALLNKACANTLLGVARPESSKLEWKDAAVSAERAIQMTKNDPDKKSTYADSHVILGIIAALEGDNRDAKKRFKKAKEIEKGHLLAIGNSKVLEEETFPVKDQPDPKGSDEKIDGIRITEMNFGKGNVKFEHGITEKDSIKLWRMEFPDSYVLVNEKIKIEDGKTNKKYGIFHLTEETYKGQTSEGITLENGNRESIELAYGGPPHKQIRLANGSFLHYKFEKQELIFQLGPEGNLLRWCVFMPFG